MKIFLFVGVLSVLLFGQPKGTSPEVKCEPAKANDKIVIDGKLDESIWASAQKSTINYEISPGDNLPAQQKADFYSAYDDKYLYFAFKCYDLEPDKVRAHQTERDQIFNDDFVGIMLDPYCDNQKVYEFFVNPFGIQGDLIRTGNNEDASFDALWQSAGQVTSFGYSVEIAIPFSSIRFPQKPVSNWRLTVLRIYPRESRFNFSWTPFDKNNPCSTCQAGLLTGLENVTFPSKIEVLPYFVGFQKGLLNNSDDPKSGFNSGKSLGRSGVGIKITPNSDLTIESVINPDFSQVESDAQQISVNSTFALFYSEKRPFFLEGNDLYSGRVTTFYSRMINSPEFAAKVNGKADKLSYSTILAYDKHTPFILPGEESSDFVQSDEKSFSMIMRGKYSLEGESYLGAIITSKNLKSGGNQMGGIDWLYTFWSNYYFRGTMLYSYTKELNNTSLFSDTRKLGHSLKDASFNGETLYGTGVRFDFERQTKIHYLMLAYSDVAPQFQSGLGYINQTNTRNIFFENGYNIYPENSFVTGGYVFIDGSMTFNHEHQQKELYSLLGLSLQFKGQLNLFLSYLPLNNETYHGVLFNNINRGMFSIYAKPLNWFAVSLSGNLGRMIRRGDDPQMGYGHSLDFSISLTPTDELTSSFGMSRFRIANANTNELYDDGYILRNTSSYQLLKGTFIRVITEYNSFSNTLNLFPLLSYKLNPFTLFYLGSTYNAQDFNGTNVFQPTERQYFLKFQYLWDAK